MRIDYHKLVRDHIPELIRREGRQCETQVASEEEFVSLLRSKLIEEAQEAATASDAEMVKELADLLEVIDTLVAACNLDYDAICIKQAERRRDRGGFDKRLILLWTE